MALGVLNNISAINAQNNLANTQASLSKTLQQLSSGSRINSGADDAASLSLANGLQASSTALSQSAKNASEGVDFLQVADGALAQVTSLLNRAITLATEASNGTLNSSQVAAANSEYQKILTETDTINNNTEYNGINTFAKNAAYTMGSATDKIDLNTDAAGTVTVGAGTAQILPRLLEPQCPMPLAGYGEFFFELLLLVEACVVPIFCEEIFVGPDFDDAAVVEDGDLVGIANGGDTMGDEDACRCFRIASEAAKDAFFGIGVYAGQRVVEDEDRGASHERACDGGALFLSAGERHASFADNRFEALGKLFEFAADVRGIGCLE